MEELVLKYASVLLLASICSLPAFGVAHALGPVGGSDTPGDPSLLVTYPTPATSVYLSEPPKREAPAEEKVQPATPQKDG